MPPTHPLSSFESIEDPRRNNHCHKLGDILFIACCAVICGAESWNDIELYGQSKFDWLKHFLELPHGVPSDDTYRRVFTRLEPTGFEQAFRDWIQTLITSVMGDIIPIDGKRLRGAFRASKENVIHQVSAWSCRHQLVLGQVKTAAKSNEITAIPELLKLLEVKGAVITIDAMGTQTEIATQIIEQEADYLLALKGNHGTLHQDVADYFDYLSSSKSPSVSGIDYYEALDKGHGRLETRCCQVVTAIDWLEGREDWKGLSSLIKIHSHTEHLLEGRISEETRYYLSSLSRSAKESLEMVRAHWQIENNLHWVLDVSFSEEASLIHTPNAAVNFSLLRKIAMTLLKQDKSKGSLKSKRKRAGWNNDFLLSLLQPIYSK